MAVIGALVPEGTRVRIRRGALPLDPNLVGRTGILVDASEYHAHCYGVLLDHEAEVRYFAADELEPLEERALPPEREAARRRPALP